LFLRLPTGFLPTEDQDTGIVQFPAARSGLTGRTFALPDRSKYCTAEKTNVVITVLQRRRWRWCEQPEPGFVSFAPWGSWGNRKTAEAITGHRAAQTFAGATPQVYSLVHRRSADAARRRRLLMQLGTADPDQFNAARDKLLARSRAVRRWRSTDQTLPDVATCDQCRHEAFSTRSG
jgi:multidrug efflux pump